MKDLRDLKDCEAVLFSLDRGQTLNSRYLETYAGAARLSGLQVELRYRFKTILCLKLILLEQMPLLTCFGFVTRQKWLVSR